MENKIAKKFALTSGMTLFTIVAFLVFNSGSILKLNGTAGMHDGSIGRAPSNITNLALSIYPNPANDHVNLTFKLAEEENITVNVTDVVGKSNRNVYSGMFYRGENSIRIETSNMAVGIYTVTVTGVKVKGTVKLLLTH